MPIYQILDPDTEEVLQELTPDYGCYGANYGCDNERCGGCTDCLLMQARYYGYKIREVEADNEHSGDRL